MSYLFDTDAISYLLRKKPLASYASWVAQLPRFEQFTSAVSVGELYRGAYRSPERDRHVANIEDRVLPCITVLPYDTAVAARFGRISAELAAKGQSLADADVQIAATALEYELVLVTGNYRHFSRIEGLSVSRVLADARADAPSRP